MFYSISGLVSLIFFFRNRIRFILRVSTVGLREFLIDYIVFADLFGNPKYKLKYVNLISLRKRKRSETRRDDIFLYRKHDWNSLTVGEPFRHRRRNYDSKRFHFGTFGWRLSKLLHPYLCDAESMKSVDELEAIKGGEKDEKRIQDVLGWDWPPSLDDRCLVSSHTSTGIYIPIFHLQLYYLTCRRKKSIEVCESGV